MRCMVPNDRSIAPLDRVWVKKIQTNFRKNKRNYRSYLEFLRSSASSLWSSTHNTPIPTAMSSSITAATPSSGASPANFSHLLPPTFNDDVVRWLKDDCPSTDIGGFVVGEKLEVAHLYCKTSGVLAGVPFAQAVFDHLGLTVEWLIPEGTYVDVEVLAPASKKVVVARVNGPCRHILLAERTALNVLARASGVATEARKAVAIAIRAGWHGQVAGTRKTTPGFKMVEKYALVVRSVSTLVKRKCSQLTRWLPSCIGPGGRRVDAPAGPVADGHAQGT